MKYLKICMVLLCITGLSLPTMAQTEGGVKLGVNISNLHYRDGNRIFVLDSKPGIVVGGYLHFPLQNNVGIVTELVYSQLGARNVRDNYQTNLNYISIPVLLRYRAGKILHLDGGFNLGLLAAAKQRRNGIIYDIQNDYTPTDLGLNLGIGLSLASGIGVDLRYLLGLTNVDNLLNRFDYVEKNRAVQITVNYRLM